LEALIIDLLASEGIDVIQVESRAKTVASFQEKLKRKDYLDANPFDAMTDLAGIRVITYYLEDVARVGELLNREFVLDLDQSMDKAEALASNQFGYRSAHYVGSMSAARAALIEWRAFADLVVELQVRTALQHAWAAVSHKLEYKSADEAPATVRRRLYRLSALFELADEQFSVLRDEREATATQYSRTVTQGRLAEVPIDTSSLETYWQSEQQAKQFAAALAKKGFITESVARINAPRLALDRRDLVRVAREAGIRTLADLDQYLHRTTHLNALMDVFREVATGLSEDENFMKASVEDALTELLIVDADLIESKAADTYLADTRRWLQVIRTKALARGLELRVP